MGEGYLPVRRKGHCEDGLNMSVEYHSRPARPDIPNTPNGIQSTISGLVVT